MGRMFAELATTVSLHCTFIERGGTGRPDGTERFSGRIYVDYDRRYAFYDLNHPNLGQLESRLIRVSDENISLYDGFFDGFNRVHRLEVNRSTGELDIVIRQISNQYLFRGTCEPGPEITPPQAPTPKF